MIPLASFGFIFLFVFIIFPICCVLLLLWIFTRKIIFGKAILYIFFTIIGLAIFGSIIGALTSKIELEKVDYYGQYIIDRKQFPGIQSDWQYNSFRLEIKPNDSIYFYCTDGKKILKTYRGVITTIKPYNSERLIINMVQPPHHIVQENPTTYRGVRNFYLVFESDKFKNVFFKKGTWKPLSE